MLSSRSILKSNPPINQLVWLVNEQPLAKIMATREPQAGAETDRDPADHLIFHSPGDQLDEPDQHTISTFPPGRRSAAGDADAHINNNELLNQSGWRFVPTLNLLPYPADQYTPGPAWNELLVTSGPSVSTAQFQCLAISSFGQTMSSKVDLDLPCK